MYRGRGLPSGYLKDTRPTTDFARSGLFNMLRSRIQINGISALDLFAGTGSVGFELVSAGAAHVVFVDESKECIKFMKKAAILFPQADIEIIHSEVFRVLKNRQSQFDIVFADPPFELKREKYKLLISLVLKTCLKPGGLLILEHFYKEKFDSSPDFTESRSFGNSTFSFFAQPKSKNENSTLPGFFRSDS